MKKSLKLLMILSMTFILLLMLFSKISVAEEQQYSETSSTVIVTAKLLNGRASPSKTAQIEARFDKGDELIATGEWSDDHHWIEVVGGETGTVWIYADYVSEYRSYFYVINQDYKKVKIRSRPFDGKITGYLKKGKMIEVSRVVLGWGKTPKGWIDMRLVEFY